MSEFQQELGVNVRDLHANEIRLQQVQFHAILLKLPSGYLLDLLGVEHELLRKLDEQATVDLLALASSFQQSQVPVGSDIGCRCDARFPRPKDEALSLKVGPSVEHRRVVPTLQAESAVKQLADGRGRLAHMLAAV